jgi:hypothetical protein
MAHTHLHSSWKDHVFSQELVALIAEDKEIKQALFPPCGPTPSSAKGGGEPKINAQWKLSMLLLGDKPKYRVSIAAAATAVAAKDTKAKQGYANEIKNRLDKYESHLMPLSSHLRVVVTKWERLLGPIIHRWARRVLASTMRRAST